MKTLKMTSSDMILKEFHVNRKRIMGIGIVTVVLGLIGAYMSDTTTIATTVFFGMLVIFGGLMSTVETFASSSWKEKLLNVLVSIIYYFLGSIILLYPFESATWLTLALAMVFVTIGVLRIVMSIQYKKEISNWDWLIFQGFLNIIIGMMILFQWPVSGLWVIGMFMSIEIILLGLNTIFFASNIKELEKKVTMMSKSNDTIIDVKAQ